MICELLMIEIILYFGEMITGACKNYSVLIRFKQQRVCLRLQLHLNYFLPLYIKNSSPLAVVEIVNDSLTLSCTNDFSLGMHVKDF